MSRPPAPLITYCKSEYPRIAHAGGWVACPRNMGEQKYLSLYSVRGRDCNIPGAGRGIVQRRQIAKDIGLLLISVGFPRSMNLKKAYSPST